MFELQKLLHTQKEFADTIPHKPPYRDYVFAMNIEISEFLNCLPWKWWKRHQPIDKERILDELADIIAFWLSYYLGFFNNYRKTRDIPSEQIETDISNMLSCLEHKLKEITKAQDSRCLNDFNYPSTMTMSNLTYSAHTLSKLCGIAMYYTDCTIDEIIEAYHKKMRVNHERQQNNY